MAKPKRTRAATRAELERMSNCRPAAKRLDQVDHRPDGSRGFKTTWLARLGGFNVHADDGRWQFATPAEARAIARAYRARLAERVA